MLAQDNTKKEYKKIMAEMLSSMDSESQDEKSSTSSIKIVDLANETILRFLARKIRMNSEDSL
ncbi:hypothetical protein Godav_022316 [Gossypium davidsonii]|uniref:Uncharacterized protein n=1 Tax=Gossypium davidsonii TaxID=34287 RepID=A0A7J8TH71_GOSDV|nr:hypothetical protein [Gossypium davidsonii]